MFPPPRVYLVKALLGAARDRVAYIDKCNRSYSQLIQREIKGFLDGSFFSKPLWNPCTYIQKYKLSIQNCGCDI